MLFGYKTQAMYKIYIQYVPTEYQQLKSKNVCLKHQLLLLTGIRHNIIKI